jgi:AcrR family transcriptional regulator
VTATPPLTRRKLYDLVWSRPLSTLAKELGISGTGLAKICDRLLIPYPSRGHWAKARAGRAGAPPPLPPAPEADAGPIVISADRARSRRTRTRFSPEARRSQLIDAAAELIAADGLSAASMKAVARKVGISEAMAYNYFPQRRDLLLALARRELHAMDVRRRNELARGESRQSRVELGTLAYLREVSERGALIQVLTSSAEVREGLRLEREATRSHDARRVSGILADRYNLPPDLAFGATTILTAVSLRAGRLLAAKKLALPAAERLTLAVITAGNRELARAYRPR